MDKILSAISGREDNIDATLISEVSGKNRVKGIHPIKNDSSLDGGLESVAVLCTLNGMHYPNEWIVAGKVLKYYLYGTTVKGEKRYSEDYEDNKAVINSKDNYPIYTFVRDKKGDKFSFEGVFEYYDIGEDEDKSMFFILNKVGETPKISEMNITVNDNFREGTEKERLHKYKERNPRVIKEAKRRFKERHGKLFCESCGFDFAKVYGPLGDEYIEGHHSVPVAELNEGDETNVNDIELLCANCHRMIHRSKLEYNKDSLKVLINNMR